MENKPNPICTCSKETKSIPRKMSAINIATAAVIFFFPKCPICWAAYASFFSFMGMEQFEYHSYWKYILISIFLLISCYSIWRHYQNKSWMSLLLLTSGQLLLLLFYTLNYSQTGLLILVALLLFASNIQFPRRASFKEL
jgi:mercuric ion transport protein